MRVTEFRVGRSSRRTRSQLGAGAISTLMAVLNIVVGLAFQSLLAAELGLGPMADAFQLVWGIVTFEALCFASIVITTLVPRLQPDFGGRLGAGDAVWLGGLGALVSGLHFAAALQLDGAVREIMLWASPAAVLAALSAVPQALAYTTRRFAVAALGPIANGLGVLVVALMTRGNFHAQSLGIAITVGYVAQLAVLVASLVMTRHQLSMATSVTLKTAVGSLGFTVVTKFQPVMERLLTVLLPTGATATLGFSQKIAQGLLLLSAFGISTATLPRMSELERAGRHREAAHAVARAFTLTLVCTSVIIGLAAPAVELAVAVLLERGAFSSEDSDAVVKAVVMQFGWVVGCALTGVLTAFLYAARRLARVLASSIAGLAVTCGTAFMFARIDPNLAVPIASSLGSLTVLMGACWATRATETGRFLATEFRHLTPLLTCAIAFIAGAWVIRELVGNTVLMTGCAEVLAFLLLGAFWCVRPVRQLAKEVFGAEV